MNDVYNFVRITLNCLLISGLIFLWSCAGDNESSKTVFRYNQAEGLTSLDPAFAGNQSNIWATNQLFNGLVELDNDLLVQPAIAKSWSISEDGLVYTFHLRDDVYFHKHDLFENKKRRVVASDFVYSFQRICNPEGKYNRGMWVFKGKVISDSQGNVSDTAFVALNDSTLRIYLEEPFPQFLEVLSINYTHVVPQEVAEYYGEDFRSHPIGTGPFKFKQWDESNALIFLKNEDYWKIDHQGVRLPYLDAVQISFIPDKGQAFREFLLGNLDFVSGVEESSVDEIFHLDGTVNEGFAEKYDVAKAPYLNTEYLSIQLDPDAPCYQGKDHPLLNIEFRKALNYAIDKKRLVVYLRNSLGIPGVAGIVPPSVPGYDISKVKGYSYHPALAKEHLEKARINKNTVIRMNIAKEHLALSEFLVKQWKDVLGIKVSIDIAEAGVSRDLARTGKAQLFRASWLGDYPDAENYFSLFLGSNKTPHGPNKSRYENEHYDSLYYAARTILDKQQRQKLYYQMDNIVAADAVIVPLYYDEVVQLRQKNITGLKPNGMNILKLEKVNKLK